MKKQYRLLIIDDDEETLEAFKKFFIKKNYMVESATDGLEGLKQIESATDGFDILVTDIVMPAISGVGIISIAKKKFPLMPVIAITGWGEHPEALASEAKADTVLRKPFELTKLEAIITDLLKKAE